MEEKNVFFIGEKHFFAPGPRCQLLIGSSANLHYLLPLLSSSEFVSLFSDISRCKLNFNALSSLLQITAIQAQYVQFLFGARGDAVLPRWLLYILLHILR